MDKTNNTGAEIFEVTLLMPGQEAVVQVTADEHIWDAAARQGIKLPALCHQGWCLTCAGRCEATCTVDQRDSSAYFTQDRAAGFVLLCTGKPRVNLRIRTHQASEMRRHRLRNNLPSPYSAGLQP